MTPESPIKRRKSTRINVGNVPIGDGAPIAVQSMTNTPTTDVAATVAQIKRGRSRSGYCAGVRTFHGSGGSIW